jgi:aspartate aminotransferase
VNDTELKAGRLLEVDKLSAQATDSRIANHFSTWVKANQTLDTGSVGGAGYDLSVGRYLKLPAQDAIDEATIEALRDKQTTYWDMAPDLPQLLAEKLRTENGLEVDPRRQICLTSGITPAIDTILSAFISAGDEVVTMDPDFVTTFGQVRARLGELVIAPSFVESTGVLDAGRWTFDPAGLESAITPRTKMLVYTNPNNPIGYVYTDDDLRAIADIAERHDLVVLENQCYERIVHSDEFARSLAFSSLATLPGMSERVITTQGVSKGFHLSGYRVGWVVASSAIVDVLMFTQMWSSFSMAPTITQYGVAAALTSPLREQYARDSLAVYRENIDTITTALLEIPEVECARPAGGPFCFMDIRGTGMTDREVTERLYAEGVNTTFGAPWGRRNGTGHVRLALSNDPTYHREAVGALVTALKKILVA